MENQENRATIASIMRESKSESQQHARAQSQTQSEKDEPPHSPLGPHSPPRSDQPPEPSLEPSLGSTPENASYYMAIVPVGNKYFQNSPDRSPLPENQKSPENTNFQAENVPSPAALINRSMREQQSPALTKVGPGGGGSGGERFGSGGGGEEGRGERRAKERGLNTTVRRSHTEVMVNRAALGFRVCEVVFCLISLSVMAADRTQGWSGDSFYRYKEYRYCLSVTVIAFVYAGFQAYDLSYHWIRGKHVIQHHLRYHLDFVMDQILAYLLISASSSAATRAVDWQSNWGKDEFTEMAIVSISMSFLAFAAFALSSLISGYNLCNRNIT